MKRLMLILIITLCGVCIGGTIYGGLRVQQYQKLVYAHGGSFTGGDKRRGSGVIDIPAMTRRGDAATAVNYRLMPEYLFPAEIQDGKCAIRFLRAHAGDYNLRTEKGEYLDYPIFLL